MNKTENNEIDLLLRSLAQRAHLRPTALESHSEQHLDADELSSYAEQALPAATRARYTSHLADCSSCRKIVSELTAVAGNRFREPLVSPDSSAGLIERLGALLSPRLLRYVVPALAVVIFVVVGWVALFQSQQTDFVAQNQQANQPVNTPATPSVVAESTKSTGELQDAQNSTPAINDSRSPESGRAAGKGRDEEAAKPNNSSKATDAVSANSDKDVAAKKAGEDANAFSPEPTAPPPPKEQSTPTEARTEVAARQKEEAEKRNEPQQREVARRRDDNQNQVAAPAAGVGSLAIQSEDKLRKAQTRPSKAAGAKADEESDTRTVSGRQFRKQGGVWIDTAYQSSSPTTTIARDSEQFRALTADEPGIRTIAAQLSGEVIVVWKGRAYRIR
jgi:hypothetical protein